jgi:hypothetical protein
MSTKCPCLGRGSAREDRLAIKTKAAWVMSHPEIRVQYDAINAVIAAAQEILIKSAQSVAHEGHGR